MDQPCLCRFDEAVSVLTPIVIDNRILYLITELCLTLGLFSSLIQCVKGLRTSLQEYDGLNTNPPSDMNLTTTLKSGSVGTAKDLQGGSIEERLIQVV